MDVITRKAAKAADLTHYFTGKPCKRGGHIDKRYVASFACATCAREKALDTFRNLDHERREARREYERKRWRDPGSRKRRSKYAATFAAYRLRHKQEQPDYFREHYAKNKEKRKRQASEWYHANSERALANRKEYVAANRDKARIWGRKSANTRRALTKQVFIEVVDPRVVFERDKGQCGICMKVVDVNSQWEVDHIVPISKGGTHCYANVQLAHRRCNRSKGAKAEMSAPSDSVVLT